ncbi:ELM1/GtrOC1 family putative glycosyltransferase [Sulfurovum sp. ST-21]|uniref:Mitochondrial fission ELM1 family protein n=1 Tax=Sulfurovum indicum TaxID=2779528 RepID=A0A7M1S6K4_9BACT|nr:ELM1/GtrOC1 family putative glycosyltransferase [Sulfurovum indicum]QOR62329.1 mitochondrial fission ELM1 family protein [Sulfurovum indicum]
MSCVLILSDGRAGHLNQSVALAEYLKTSYEIVEVLPKYRWSKWASYLLDKVGVCTDSLFQKPKLEHDDYDLVIGAGSRTYYMLKVLAKQFSAKSVTMMLPRGYRYDYDLIFAQSHDKPPKEKNIIELPANFAYVEPRGIYRASKNAIGVVIGGENKVFRMNRKRLKEQLDLIVEEFKGYEVAVTTSPRTPKEIESLIREYQFDYEVVYSDNPVNPIPDFLDQCETVFLTADSTSMISEAISYGSANVVVLPLEAQKENKFTRFIDALEQEGYLAVIGSSFKRANRKIDFSKYAAKALW